MKKNIKQSADFAYPKYGMSNIQPACRWEDAYPCGNGPIGVLVFGNIHEELIIINEESLWFQRKKKYPPNISDTVPELREMLKNGEWAFSDNFFAVMLQEKGFIPCETDPYHPAFDISIKYDPHAPFQDYARILDFETGEAIVRWKELPKGSAQKAVQFQRECFVSRADNVVVVRFHSDGLPIDARINLISHPMKPNENYPLRFDAKAEDSWISFAGEYLKNGQIKLRREPRELVDYETLGKANEFGGVAKVILTGGSMSVVSNWITVKGAKEILLLVKVFVHEKSIDAFPRLKKELNALKPDFNILKSRHIDQHRALFSRLLLDLKCEGSDFPQNGRREP